MTLYWDREGRVACGDHAPLKNPEAWRLQNWKPISPSGPLIRRNCRA